jgi:N-acetylglucosamine-6-phosphate deacetylase
MEKLGIDQILKAQNLAVEGGNVAEKVLSASGAVAKFSALGALFDEIIALSSFNPAAALAQIKDLDDAEKAQLVAAFKEKFDIADDQVEAKIEAGVGLVAKAEGLVQEIIAYSKSLKPAAPQA